MKKLESWPETYILTILNGVQSWLTIEISILRWKIIILLNTVLPYRKSVEELLAWKSV